MSEVEKSAIIAREEVRRLMLGYSYMVHYLMAHTISMVGLVEKTRQQPESAEKCFKRSWELQRLVRQNLKHFEAILGKVLGEEVKSEEPRE